MRVVHVVFIFLISNSANLFPITYGSNDSVSRQQRLFFPQIDTDNAINGFTVVNNGMTLESSNTQVTYDGFFHISGDVVFNYGVLNLNQNIEFKSPIHFSIGCINANKFSILFPDNLSLLNLPNVNHDRLLDLKDQQQLSSQIFSADWSWDNNYIAVAAAGNSSDPEVTIYLFQDETITLTASTDSFANNDVNAVRWSPDSYFLATAQAGLLEDQLKTFSYDASSATLIQVDSASGLTELNAISWSPTGTAIAVGGSLNQLRVYPINQGQLGIPITASLPAGSIVQPDTISWHSSGNYIAIGVSNALMGNELHVFDFDGASLSAAGSKEIGAAVNAVRWRPNDFLLAIGHANSGDRLQLFVYDPSGDTLTEQTTARTGQQIEPYSVDWSSDGGYLVVGVDSSVDINELEVYSYDTTEKILNLVSCFPLNNLTRTVRFNNNSADWIIAGDSGNTVSLFSFNQPFRNNQNFAFVFDNAKIFFKSDVTFRGPILVKGDCIINGGNNAVDLCETGSLVVDVGGSLILENMSLEGIQGTNLRCLDDNSSITLRDIIWKQDSNFTFTTGSLLFKDTVTMQGNNLFFAYQSDQPSSIATESMLTFDSGFTFSYDPFNGSRHLFSFEDTSAMLVLNSASLHTTSTGLQLTKGKIVVAGESKLSTERLVIEEDDGVTTVVNNGLTLGDGTSGNDCSCVIVRGSLWELTTGLFQFNNTSATSITMENDLSRFKINTNARFLLSKSLSIDNGQLIFADRSILIKEKDTTLTGSIFSQGTLIKIER